MEKKSVHPCAGAISHVPSVAARRFRGRFLVQILLIPALVTMLYGTVYGEHGERSEGNLSRVIISEFMVQQNQTLADPDFGRFSGWIELHNRSRRKIDLSGWLLVVYPPDVQLQRGSRLPADVTNTTPIIIETLPEGTEIPRKGYLLIWTDGQAMSGQALHAGFKLPEPGAVIALYDSERNRYPLVDFIGYGPLDVAPDISIGRITFERHQPRWFQLPMNHPTPGKENRLKRLQERVSFRIRVLESSGLAPDHTGRYLWTVSDQSGGNVYKLSKEGRVIERFASGGGDLEGITQHPRDRTLWVVDEAFWEVVQFDTLGTELTRFEVDTGARRHNQGLEGITLDPAHDHLYVVNEKNPRVMIVYDVSNTSDIRHLRTIPLDFNASPETKGLDLSGLFFDERNQVLWLVSDEASAVILLDLDGRPLAAYETGVINGEGVTVIHEDKIIYLVSDERNRLYHFDLPDPVLRLPAARDKQMTQQE